MRPWIVWATGLLAYIVAVLDRTTLGVSGLEAGDRFAAGPGLLSSFVVLQIVVYAGAQVPAGLLLDRFGSKALILSGATVMAAGQLTLAFTESLPVAIAARAVVGLGDAVTFISVLRLVPHWFRPNQVPLVTQLTGICGQLGQVLSAVPFLALLAGEGWTTAYLSVVALGVVSIVLTFALVKNTPDGKVDDPPSTSVREVLASVKTVWLRPGTRLGFFTHMGTQFSVTVFALMWGLPYLTVGQGLSVHVAGTLLSLSVVAAIVSGIVIGIFTGRRPHRRSRLVLAIIASNAAIWTVVLALPSAAPLWLLTLARHRHLGRRPWFDGRLRLRPHVQSEHHARHRAGHGEHGRLPGVPAGDAGDGPGDRRGGRLLVRVVPAGVDGPVRDLGACDRRNSHHPQEDAQADGRGAKSLGGLRPSSAGARAIAVAKAGRSRVSRCFIGPY